MLICSRGHGVLSGRLVHEGHAARSFASRQVAELGRPSTGSSSSTLLGEDSALSVCTSSTTWCTVGVWRGQLVRTPVVDEESCRTALVADRMLGFLGRSPNVPDQDL